MTNDFRGLYDIRQGKESDNNFVLATMLRGLYYGDSWFSTIPKAIFMSHYKQIVSALLRHPKTLLQVACLKDDPDVILGYSLLSSDYQTVHWVFVKSAWRNKGIARALVPHHPEAVTHLTALGKTLLPKLPNALFNPFLL